MFTYRLHFKENNNRSNIIVKNLMQAENVAVIYLKSDPQVKTCEITTPSGAISIVRKDGSYHWNHDGFSFSMIQGENVEKYKS